MEEFIEEARSTLCGWDGCEDCVYLRKSLNIIESLIKQNVCLRQEYVDTFLSQMEGNSEVSAVLLPIETIVDAANWGENEDIHLNNIHLACIKCLRNE